MEKTKDYTIEEYTILHDDGNDEKALVAIPNCPQDLVSRESFIKSLRFYIDDEILNYFLNLNIEAELNGKANEFLDYLLNSVPRVELEDETDEFLDKHNKVITLLKSHSVTVYADVGFNNVNKVSKKIYYKEFNYYSMQTEKLLPIIPNMYIINKTPHPVILLDKEYKEIRRFEKGDTIRLSQITEQIGVARIGIGHVPISQTIFGEPENLPDYKEGVYYIVSQLVKNALPERDDLLVPAEIVRNESGVIKGCQSLGL